MAAALPLAPIKRLCLLLGANTCYGPLIGARCLRPVVKPSGGSSDDRSGKFAITLPPELSIALKT